MWTLENALILIRELQKSIRRWNYHVTVGGGVLNKGRSDKDLDLYFIPFSEQGPDPKGLREFLKLSLGAEYTLGGPEVLPADTNMAYLPEPMWINGRFTYRKGDRRVDAFIG